MTKTAICPMTEKPITGGECFDTSMVMERMAPLYTAHIPLTKEDVARLRDLCLTCPYHPK